MMDAALLKEVRARLHGVVEPCSIAMRARVSIVQMGLVEDISLEAGTLRVTLCLTDTACVHFAGMQRHIADALAGLEGVARVEVIQVTDQLWTPDRFDLTAA